MTIDDALRSKVASLGASFGTRAYLQKAPERPVLPYVVILLIDEDPIMTQTGAPSLRRVLYQFSAFSDEQREAITAVEEIRAALNGFTGAMEAVSVKAVHFEGRRRTYESDTKLHHDSADARIQYVA